MSKDYEEHFRNVEIGGEKIRAKYNEWKHNSDFWKPKYKSKWHELWDDITIPFYRIRYKVKDIYWKIRYGFQRMFHGYDNVDTFETFAKFIERYEKILTDYRKYHVGYVGTMTAEEWDAIIDEMILHLHYMDESNVIDELERDVPDDWSADYTTINYILDSHKDRFFRLFSEYFYNLWD
jgi:hypothetical protein